MRKPASTFHRLAAGLVIALAATALPAFAQDTTKQAEAITDAQQKMILQLFTRIDGQIAGVLAKEPARVAQMKAQLEKISSLKIEAERNQAIASYQAKHGPFYADALAKAGVSLPSVAKELRRILPNMAFTVQPNLTLVAIEPEPPATTATATPPSIRNVGVGTFDTYQNNECGLAAGANNRFGSRSLFTVAAATVLGVCKASGGLSAELSVENARSAIARSVHNYKLSVRSVAVGGGSLTLSEVTIRATPHRLARHSIGALAPLLWIASLDREGTRINNQVQLTPGTPSTLSAETRASTVSVVGSGSVATAEIGNFYGGVDVER